MTPCINMIMCSKFTPLEYTVVYL